jgi:hypothetical protein
MWTPKRAKGNQNGAAIQRNQVQCKKEKKGSGKKGKAEDCRASVRDLPCRAFPFFLFPFFLLTQMTTCRQPLKLEKRRSADQLNGGLRSRD